MTYSFLGDFRRSGKTRLAYWELVKQAEVLLRQKGCTTMVVYMRQSFRQTLGFLEIGVSGDVVILPDDAAHHYLFIIGDEYSPLCVVAEPVAHTRAIGLLLLPDGIEEDEE